jgi:hypothetical protein
VPVLVRNHDDGLVEFAVNLFYQFKNIFRTFTIQVGTRLICEEDLRFVDYCPGD